MTQTIYIAGPMTDLPERNYPLFRRVEANLTSLGFKVESPCHPEDKPTDPHPWEWYMRRALKQLMDCQMIIMLPGWEKSKGARLEKYVAEQLGMPVMEWMELNREVVVDHRPHSRACGAKPHNHGSECHRNCPTCGAVSRSDNWTV